MPNIIVKKYEHYNRSLGKHITSKRQYDNEMAKQGMVPFEKGKQLAEEHKRKTYKPYDKPSPKAMDLIRGISDHQPDKKGKIKLSDREIDAMKKIGVSFDPKFKPNGKEGGF